MILEGRGSDFPGLFRPFSYFCSTMYRDFIQRKFPANESEGLYVAPQLPGSKLGRILMKETRIAQPGDVVAMFLDTGFFGGTYFLLTDTKAYYPGGEFDLERVRNAEADGKNMQIHLGTNTGTSAVRVKLGDSDAASIIAKVLDDLAFHDAGHEQELQNTKRSDYSQFEGQAIDWLLLRDEIMRTIDLLHEKFQDGKLSLLEYENKKLDLLNRL